YGKRTAFDEYPKKGRAGIGVRNLKTTGRNGEVVALLAVREDQEIMVASEQGMLARMAARVISILGRGTQGVRIMRLNDGDRIVSVAVTAERSSDDDGPDSGVTSVTALPETEPDTEPDEPDLEPDDDEPGDEGGDADDGPASGGDENAD